MIHYILSLETWKIEVIGFSKILCSLFIWYSCCLPTNVPMIEKELIPNEFETYIQICFILIVLSSCYDFMLKCRFQ